jgi:diguanylate cyclase (GGDEF)-like protein
LKERIAKGASITFKGREAKSGNRDDAANKRDVASEKLDVASNLRDRAADARDLLAVDRDEAASLRDHEADDRDSASARTRTLKSGTETSPEASARESAASDRKWSAKGRAASMHEREHALDDRDNAAEQRSAGVVARSESAADRGSSAADRRFSAQQLANAAMDALTGAYLRGPGIAEIQREVERAVRTSSSLILVFIDVDSLKMVNDSQGHAAGDRLLVAVVRVLMEKLRPYDRIVRYGGDEFVCALSDMTETDAAARLADVNTALSTAKDRGSVTFGLATMAAGDSVASLIVRADSALLRDRKRK